MSIIVKLEDEFGIEFDVDDLNIAKWENVKDVISAVEIKTNEKAER